jgi:formylglycine-generating enzyme required for sulfatase activity
MVAVDGFCIDSTEVTNAHYQTFLASAPDASLFPPTCTAWKSTFKQMVAPPPGSDDYPAVWVDWCDAYAYCAWAGKRLCGRIGGGPLAPGGMNDVAQDEWYAACSNVGANQFPYGNTFDPSACNGPERDAGSVLPPTSLPNCTGGVAGISQMVGNADEWIDSCASGMTGPEAGAVKCERRSGSWDNPAGTMQTCAFSRTGSRNEEDSDIGFRCCADLAP